MNNGISWIIGLATLIPQLKSWLRKLEIRKQVILALEIELESLERNFNEMMESVKICYQKLLKLSNEIGEGPARKIALTNLYTSNIRFHKVITNFSKDLSNFLGSFVKFSRACYQISSNEASMNEIKETNPDLYKLISTMANIYKGDYVEINSQFIGFLRLHRESISKGLTEAEREFSLNSTKSDVESFNRLVLEILEICQNIEIFNKIKPEIYYVYRDVLDVINNANRIKVSQDLEEHLVEDLCFILDSTSMRIIKEFWSFLNEINEIIKTKSSDFKPKKE
ncbi:MAG: hypothetical protein QXO16_05110 [Archaeoglobaceae archaeon]